MPKTYSIVLLLSLVILLQGCGPYSFTGADINYSTTKTVQVNYFQNNAPIVEPGIARDFTQKLQDLLLNQTSLDLVNNNGDLVVIPLMDLYNRTSLGVLMSIAPNADSSGGKSSNSKGIRANASKSVLNSA